MKLWFEDDVILVVFNHHKEEKQIPDVYFSISMCSQKYIK